MRVELKCEAMMPGTIREDQLTREAGERRDSMEPLIRSDRDTAGSFHVSALAVGVLFTTVNVTLPAQRAE